MARKQKKTIKKTSAIDSENPLAQVEELNIKELRKSPQQRSTQTAVSDKPISPLGPPQIVDKPTLNGPSSQNGPQVQELSDQLESIQGKITQLKRANKRLEKRNIELETAVKLNKNLEDALATERHRRLDSERQAATVEGQLSNLTDVNNMLESIRRERLELEKQVASLKVRAERTQEMAIMLNEEREARQKLEKEKASLEVQVESLKKLDTLLAEERQARMNAQSRAASAEAQLARLEGELKNNLAGSRGSLLDRLRGR